MLLSLRPAVGFGSELGEAVPFASPVPVKSQGASCAPVTVYGLASNLPWFQVKYCTPTSAASGRPRSSRCSDEKLALGTT